MTDREIRMLITGCRVQSFLDGQAKPTGAAIRESLRSTLDTAVADLAAHQLEQGTAQVLGQIETALVAAYRRDCYERFIRPIGTIARYAFRKDPDFRRLALPASAARTKSITKKATRLAEAAAHHEAAFVSNGMPADFIDQLRAAIARITESAKSCDSYRRRQTAATVGARTAARSVSSVVRIIDSVLRPALKGDAAVLVEWIDCQRRAAPVATRS